MNLTNNRIKWNRDVSSSTVENKITTLHQLVLPNKLYPTRYF